MEICVLICIMINTKFYLQMQWVWKGNKIYSFIIYNYMNIYFETNLMSCMLHIKYKIPYFKNRLLELSFRMQNVLLCVQWMKHLCTLLCDKTVFSNSRYLHISILMVMDIHYICLLHTFDILRTIFLPLQSDECYNVVDDKVEQINSKWE